MLAGLLNRRAATSAFGSLDAAADWPDQVISALETRALWAKYGI
jgi:serine protease SohB